MTILGHPVYGTYVRTYADVWLGATHMRAFPCPYVHSFKHTSTSLYRRGREKGGHDSVLSEGGWGDGGNSREFAETERLAERARSKAQSGNERDKEGPPPARRTDPRYFSRPGAECRVAFPRADLHGRATPQLRLCRSFNDDGILHRQRMSENIRYRHSLRHSSRYYRSYIKPIDDVEELIKENDVY